MLTHVVAGKIKAAPGGANQFETDINTFLNQHPSEAIESIQTICTDGGKGIGDQYFCALCVIVFDPTRAVKKPGKKKSGK